MSSKHDALKADFAAALTSGYFESHEPFDAEKLADRLVHLVVLHGLLPETDAMVEIGDPLFNEDGTPWQPAAHQRGVTE